LVLAQLCPAKLKNLVDQLVELAKIGQIKACFVFALIFG
jgi:hypothetical protein